MEPMNERPTPETDAFFRSFADGEATPSHAEYYDRMTQLERERDEALEEGLEQARLLGMSGEREARLIRERDELLDQLTKLEHSMPEELARLERERDEAREQWRISSACRILREQRDRLAEACRWAQMEIGKHTRPSPIDTALAAVEGGKHE